MHIFVVPSIIATIMITCVVIVLVLRAKRVREFQEVLIRNGFTPEDIREARFDFSSTLQWPQGRGIDFDCLYVDKSIDGVIGVANVNCSAWVSTDRGATPTRFNQTVLHGRFPGNDFGRFCLCPADWATQYRRYSEGGTVHKTGDEEFDEAFFIIGEQDAPVKEILSDDVRFLMSSMPDVMMTVGKESVMLFEQGNVLVNCWLEDHIELLRQIRQDLAGSTPTQKGAEEQE